MELMMNNIKDRFNEWAYNLWCKIGIKNRFHERYLNTLENKALHIKKRDDNKKAMMTSKIRRQRERKYRTIKRKKK